MRSLRQEEQVVAVDGGVGGGDHDEGALCHAVATLNDTLLLSKENIIDLQFSELTLRAQQEKNFPANTLTVVSSAHDDRSILLRHSIVYVVFVDT